MRGRVGQESHRRNRTSEARLTREARARITSQPSNLKPDPSAHRKHAATAASAARRAIQAPLRGRTAPQTAGYTRACEPHTHAMHFPRAPGASHSREWAAPTRCAKPLYQRPRRAGRLPPSVSPRDAGRLAHRARRPAKARALRDVAAKNRASVLISVVMRAGRGLTGSVGLSRRMRRPRHA